MFNNSELAYAVWRNPYRKVASVYKTSPAMSRTFNAVMRVISNLNGVFMVLIEGSGFCRVESCLGLS